MQVTQRGQRFVVLDDVLDAAELADIRRVMANTTFSAAESALLAPEDGSPQRARSTVIRSGAADQRIAGDPEAYARILAAVSAERAVFGEPESDWDRVGFTFWNYPVGSRLGWHGDAGGGRTGSYVLSLHEEWHASWGGELMILDEDSTGVREGGTAAMEEWVGQSALSPVAVLPKPNRLVFLKAGTPHRVNRVDPTAALVRRTLTGHVTKRSGGAGEETRNRFRQFMNALEGASE